MIGFAAETENLVENAKKKLLKKKCDMDHCKYSSNKKDLIKQIIR